MRVPPASFVARFFCVVPFFCLVPVVAAPASGHGKTTVATGLMAALRRTGLEVSGHKVGPDYIDPGYHALATGRPGRNLDAVLCGEHRIAPLYRHGARDADIAVIGAGATVRDVVKPGEQIEPGDVVG